MPEVGAQLLTVYSRHLGEVEVQLRTYAFRAGAEERTVRLFFFKRDEELLQRAVQKLTDAAYDGSLPQEIMNFCRAQVGARIWSRLRPETDKGATVGIGGRRVHFGHYVPFVEATYGAGSGKSAWDLLAERGREHWPEALPTLLDVKHLVHFPEWELPSPADVITAHDIMADSSADLADAEQRRLGRWQPAAPAARQHKHKAQKPTTELDRRLRRVAERYLRKHKVSPEARSDVLAGLSLLSYRQRLLLDNFVAQEVRGLLPPELLEGLSGRVFDYMWIGDEAFDLRGRCDLPIMGSPALGSVVEYLAFAEDPADRKHSWVLDDLLAFADGAVGRNKGVDIALGIADTYQAWLAHERSTDQERSPHGRGRLVPGREHEMATKGVAEALDEWVDARQQPPGSKPKSSG